MKTYLVAMLVIAWSLIACNEADFGAETDTVKKKDPPSSDDVIRSGGPERDPTDPVITDDGSIQFAVTGDVNQDPVNFVFVMDTSFSMHDDLDKLKDSLKTLITGVDDAGINYASRFLTMKMLEDSLQVIYAADGSFKAPSGYTRLSNAPKMTKAGGLSPLEQAIDQLKEDRTGNEPGLCTGYVHLKTAADYGPDEEIHIISLSDEDDSNEIEKHNKFTGELEESHPLACSYDRSSVCTEERKWSNYYDWTEYCYDYKTYRYTGTYKKPGACENKGFNETEDLYYLKSTRACSTKRYLCTDTNRIKDWSCPKAPTNEMDIVPWARHPGDHYRYCEAATHLICTITVDGVEFEERVRRGAAPAGANCVVDWTETNWQSHPQSSLPRDWLRNCSACTVNSYEQVYVLEQDVADPRYTACELVDPDYQNRTSVNLIFDTGILTAVTAKDACSEHYHFADKDRTDASNLCASEVAALTLPPFTTAIKSGESAPEIRNWNRSYTSPKTPEEIKQEIANQYGVDAEDVVITESEERQHTNVCSIYGRSANDPVRDQGGFAERITEYNDVREDEPNIPAGATPEKVYEDDGIRTECVSRENQQTVVPPEPSAVVDFFNSEEVTQDVVWHAIINETGAACDGQVEEGAQSEGIDYRSMAERTGGIVESVCEPKFDDFMANLANQVSYVVHLDYDLPGLDPAAVATVSVGGQALTAQDFVLAPGKISFVSGKIAVGDQVTITMRE